jgi:hypothetical protein
MRRDKRRFAWLDLVAEGLSPAAVAGRYRVSVRTVQLATAAARGELEAFAESRRLMTPPPLTLFFPINGLFPVSRCNHDQVAIPHGDACCCAVCHRSGRDNHPALDRFPAVEPRPDPPLAPPALAGSRSRGPTRRQKRAAARRARSA